MTDGLRSWRLALPWPVSANRYWRSIVIQGQKHAQVYVGDGGKAYRKAVAELAMVYRWPRGLIGNLQLDVIAFPPDRRARDLDNLWKAVLDVLKAATKPKDVRAGVFVDDKQIASLSIRRGPIVPNGLLHAVLSELPASGCDLAVGSWPPAPHSVRPHDQLVAPIGLPEVPPLRPGDVLDFGGGDVQLVRG